MAKVETRPESGGRSESLTQGKTTDLEHPLSNTAGDEGFGPSDRLIGNSTNADSSSVETVLADLAGDTPAVAIATPILSSADVTVIESLDARGGGDLTITDLTYIYDGIFIGQGADLLLVKADGTAILVENYFAVPLPPISSAKPASASHRS